MTLLEKNPEAIRFNIDKKLAQLNKVIFLFQCDEEERNLQKKYLYEIYDPKIRKIIEDHNKKMVEINAKMKTNRKKDIEKISNRYNEKYHAKKKELTDTINTVNQKHSTQIDEHDELVKFAQKTIIDINKKLDEEIKLFKIRQSRTLEKLKKFQNDSKIKFKEDFEEHTKNSKERLKQLQENHKKKIDKMKSKHQENIKQCKQDFRNNKFKVTLKFNKNDFQDSLNQNKIDVQKILDENKKKLKNNSLLISKEVNNLLMFRDEIQKKYANHKKNIQESMTKLTIEPIRKDLFNSQRRFKQDQENLSNLLAQSKEKNQEKFDKNKQKLDQEKKNLSKLIEDLKNKIQNEIKTEKENINKIEKKRESEIDNKKKNVNEKIENLKRDVELLLNNKIKERKNHVDQLEVMKKQNSREKSELLYKHSQSISSLRKSIKENQDKLKTESDKLYKSINELNSSKENINNARKQLLSDDNIQQEKEINELKQSLKNEIETIMQQEEQKLKDVQFKNNDIISKNKEILNIKKNDFIKKLDNNSQKSLENLKILLHKTQKEKDEKILSEYQKKEKDLEMKLNIIQTTNQDAQEKFKKLSDIYDKLQEERNNLKDRIKKEKDELINLTFKKQIENENKRHLNVLSSLTRPNSGRNRQQTLQSLKHQINVAIENKYSQIKSLNDERMNLESQYKTIISSFEKDKKYFIKQSKDNEQNLRSNFNILQTEGDKKILSKTKFFDEEIAKLKAIIEKMQIHYIRAKEEYYDKTTIIIDKFNHEEADLKENLQKITIQNRSKLSNTIKAHNELMVNMNTSHVIQTGDVRSRIRIISDRVRNDKIQLEDQRKRLNSTNLDKISQFEKGARFSIQKMKDDNEGLNGYLDERIEVLEKQNQSPLKLSDDPSKVIEILKQKLAHSNNRLASSINDLKRYKSMSKIEQDNRLNNNSVFVKPKKIGIVITKAPH